MADTIQTAARLVLFLPFLSFAVLGVVVPLRRSGRPAGYFSVTAIGLSFLAALWLLWQVWNHPGAYEFEFTWMPFKGFSPVTVGILIDTLSATMLLVVALVAFMVQVYSLGYMSEEPPGSLGRYFTYHSLFAFSMMGLVAANSLLEIYVFWELVGLCSYLLIGFWYYKPSAMRAAVKAFWTTRLGDVGFAIGMVLLWNTLGTFKLTEIFRMVEHAPLPAWFLPTVSLLIFFGAMGKSAQFPLHIWLPDAMEGPTPVSALIHAATMVAAGVYLVARAFPLFHASETTMLFIAHIGAFTAFLAATMALVEEDIKRVLAYSTISQLGYMMAAMGAAAPVIGFFHLFTHAFFKALLFLAAGSVIHAMGTNSLWKMGRLAKHMPWTAAFFIIGALALSGIPPFSGFYSKDEILLALYGFAQEKGMAVPFVLALVTVFLTAFYMFRVIFFAFFGKKEAEGHPHESPRVMLWPMGVLALLAIVAGFPGESFLSFVHVKGAHALHVEAGSLPLISGGLAVLGIALAWVIYHAGWIRADKLAEASGPLYILLVRRYYLDDIALGFYRYALLGLSAVAGWFDRYIVDGVVNLVTWGTAVSGRTLRRMQTGFIQDYLFTIITGILLLALLGYLIVF